MSINFWYLYDKIVKSLIFTTIISTASLFGYDFPYSVEKFQKVLDSSKLQAPTSNYNSKWGTKYGKFSFFANRYFYLQDGKYMAFEMCHTKHRSELRQREEWQVTTDKPKVLEAEVKLFPLSSKREFTFLQIHTNPHCKTEESKNSINKPLLRIAWRREYRGLKKHIWAIIRISSDIDEHRYIKIDLDKNCGNFFKIKIVVLHSNLKIYVDKKLKVDMDIEYWKGLCNYFKEGVYMQDNGCAKALFKELSIR